jgi:uncharacterized membrane protein
MTSSTLSQLSIGSIITVISIIVLTMTFLLGEYNTEERNGRPRYQEIYSNGLTIISVGLLAGLLSLIGKIISLFNPEGMRLIGMNIQANSLSLIGFTIAIIVVSIGIFFITGKIIARS